MNSQNSIKELSFSNVKLIEEFDQDYSVYSLILCYCWRDSDYIGNDYQFDE